MWYKLKVLNLCCLMASMLLLCVHAEFFTAMSDVEPLLETHKKIVDDLDEYINKQEQRLNILKQHLEVYKVEQLKAMEDIPKYLGNPINVYKLIKRLTIDLDYIEDSIAKGTEYVKNRTMIQQGVKYPTLEDLAGAAQALTRLQHTYRLQVSDLSEGKLIGVIHRNDEPSNLKRQTEEAISTPMSAGDCYNLGLAAYNDYDYKNALSWMTQAHRKFKEGNDSYPFTESHFLDHISFYHAMLGDVRAALQWTKELLAVEPTNPRARGNILYYQKAIDEEDKKLKKTNRDEEGEEQVNVTDTQPMSLTRNESFSYEALCRGEMDLPPEVSKSLKCRYLTENHPFLKIAPIKMEQMYVKPDIMMFYDVLSDEESEHIKELAKPKFLRATVQDPVTGKNNPAYYRISKSSWLSNEESPVVARLSQRITDFTGLNLEFSEDLQVANYGIGGHYVPHFDFAKKNDHPYGNAGNRIATVLFYMTGVEQGGATVFTELGLSVFPVARAAAFWLNLHPSGEGDFATEHAACPVLRGSKWVCNKWIVQKGQELIKPCDLEYQEEGIIRKSQNLSLRFR